MPRIRQFLYLLLVSCAVFSVYAFSHNSQSYWLIWSALVLSFITLGETFRQRLMLITAAGVMTAAMVVLIGGISFNLYVSAISLFVVTVAAAYLSQSKPSYFFIALIMNVFVVLAGSFPVSWPLSLERGLFVLGGAGIAAGCQIIFWPYYVRNEVICLMRKAVASLMRTNDDVFSCLLQPDYADNLYLYERRIHVQKRSFLQAMKELRDVQPLCGKLSAEMRSRYVMMTRLLDALFASVMDCSLLRWRAGDMTVFGVCVDELNGVLAEMRKIFIDIDLAALGKKQQATTEALREKMRYFEDNYQTVLQVTAKEPLVFLLFLGALQGFCEVIEEMAVIKQPVVRI